MECSLTMVGFISCVSNNPIIRAIAISLIKASSLFLFAPILDYFILPHSLRARPLCCRCLLTWTFAMAQRDGYRCFLPDYLQVQISLPLPKSSSGSLLSYCPPHRVPLLFLRCGTALRCESQLYRREYLQPAGFYWNPPRLYP